MLNSVASRLGWGGRGVCRAHQFNCALEEYSKKKPGSTGLSERDWIRFTATLLSKL
jgi:hypothetical protein